MHPPHSPQRLTSPSSPLLCLPSPTSVSMSVYPFESVFLSLSLHLFLSVCLAASISPTPNLVTQVPLPDSCLPPPRPHVSPLPLESSQGKCVHHQPFVNAPGAQPQPQEAWPQSLEGNRRFSLFPHGGRGLELCRKMPSELLLVPGCPSLWVSQEKDFPWKERVEAGTREVCGQERPV